MMFLNGHKFNLYETDHCVNLVMVTQVSAEILWENHNIQYIHTYIQIDDIFH